MTHLPNPERFLTEREAALFLRLSTRTLQRHRANGTGPAFVNPANTLNLQGNSIACKNT